MSTFEQKRAAFAAYSKSHLTDAELALAHKSICEVNETLRAMGEAGHFMSGYILFEHALESMMCSRKHHDEDMARRAKSKVEA